jgi:hypothetical protein
MIGTASRWRRSPSRTSMAESTSSPGALDERGPTDRDKLAELVGARYWGPGRFRAALREAVGDGRARRLSRSTYAPGEPSAASTRR